jgi:hypothetical protein
MDVLLFDPKGDGTPVRVPRGRARLFAPLPLSVWDFSPRLRASDPEVQEARASLSGSSLEAFDQLLSDGWRRPLSELLEVVAEL